MTNEDLCRLAIAAIDDADARVVLADAIDESGHEGARRILAGARVVYQPTARAIAAVLLLGEWCDTDLFADWEERRWFPYAERYDIADRAPRS